MIVLREYVTLSKFLFRFCNQCNTETKFRFRTSKRQRDYYTCTVCTSNQDRKSRINNWWAYLARKANARKRPESVKLTKNDIEILAIRQNNKCDLTGEIFDVKDKWWKPSLDRIDSSLGYTLDNIRLVAWIVNHCRGELSDEEFVDMCKKVVNRK
jgi:hypothetical protein